MEIINAYNPQTQKYSKCLVDDEPVQGYCWLWKMPTKDVIEWRESSTWDGVGIIDQLIIKKRIIMILL